MINNPVCLKADFILGVDNTLADAISRVYSKSAPPICFCSLMQAFLEMLSWTRLHPRKDLLSHLYSVLLEVSLCDSSIVYCYEEILKVYLGQSNLCLKLALVKFCLF